MLNINFDLQNEKIQGIGLIDPMEFFDKVRDEELLIRTHKLNGFYNLDNLDNLVKKKKTGLELEHLIKFLETEDYVIASKLEIIKCKDRSGQEQIIIRLRTQSELEDDARISEWIID